MDGAPPVRSVSKVMDPATRKYLRQTEADKPGCFVRILGLAPTLALIGAVFTAALLCGLMFFAYPHPMFIQNRANGACLEARGKDIRAVPCTASEDQHWRFVMVGGGDAHLLVSGRNATSCIQIPEDALQSPQTLGAGTCNGNDKPNQNWGFSKDDLPKGTISLQNPSPGDDWVYDDLDTAWCFQIPTDALGSTGATHVEVVECDLKGTQPSQLWDVTRQPSRVQVASAAAIALSA